MFNNYLNEIEDIRRQLMECQGKLETAKETLSRRSQRLGKVNDLIKQKEFKQTERLTQIEERKNFIDKCNRFFKPMPPNVVYSCQEAQSELDHLHKKISCTDKKINELDSFKESVEARIRIAQRNTRLLDAGVDLLRQELLNNSIENNFDVPSPACAS